MRDSICWYCNNYTKCSWGRYDDKKNKILFKPVKGWTAIYNKSSGSYRVIDCPEKDLDLTEREVTPIIRTCPCGNKCDPWRRLCPECLEKKKAEHDAKLARPKLSKYSNELCDEARLIIQANWSDLQKLKGNDRAKLRKELYRKAGICSCGRRKARKGHTTCRICAEKERIRNNRRNTNGRTRKADKGKHK